MKDTKKLNLKSGKNQPDMSDAIPDFIPVNWPGRCAARVPKAIVQGVVAQHTPVHTILASLQLPVSREIVHIES